MLQSYNLKPAVVTRPSIQGPKTNLKVAAILEKAKTIRQVGRSVILSVVCVSLSQAYICINECVSCRLLLEVMRMMMIAGVIHEVLRKFHTDNLAISHHPCDAYAVYLRCNNSLLLCGIAWRA